MWYLSNNLQIIPESNFIFRKYTRRADFTETVQKRLAKMDHRP